VVTGGKAGPECDNIGEPGLVFSPDRKRLAYRALRGGKQVMVIDGQANQDYDASSNLIFSPDSKRVAFLAQKAGRPIVVLDGRPGPDNCGVVCGPVFRHDGVLEYLAMDENKVLYRITSSQVGPAVAASEESAGRSGQDLQADLKLASGFLEEGRTKEAVEVLGRLVNAPDVDASTLLKVAQFYARAANYDGLERALEKLVQVSPTSPEAWYNLAALRITLGKKAQAVTALHEALRLSAKRREQNPEARDLVAEATRDPRFQSLRGAPEWKEIVPGNQSAGNDPK
jgi:tetratricopeptide (TPR) repeat protein